MQKIMIILIAALSISAAYKSNYTSPPTGVEVNGKVVLGRGANCSGIGICKAAKIATGITSEVAGKMVMSPGNNTFTITILETEIQRAAPDKLQYFRNKKEVVFEESFTFPQEITSLFQLKEPLTIKKGSHELQYANGSYTIVVKL